MKNKLFLTLKFIFAIMSLIVIYKTHSEWFYYGYAWTRRYAIYTAIILLMLSSISLGYALAKSSLRAYAITSILQLIMICHPQMGNFLEIWLYAIPCLIIELIILIVWKIKIKNK